ncbi:diacylglycerol/lipid kinase family protein [Olleya sp. 1-3]|uniref:diacylglycerol/lipid kinase family protein n=1 Tax=Olleya sp. 1-3 TaxID=2058323 RepID=UPI000C3289AD|nr:diacylglycerol kinase family protein [Olleya sp. 1-3]PKG52005.1 hypothetical protein CXF54_05485 [Olleya sp. 1-3]
MSEKKTFFVIINPVSGNGKGKKVWNSVKDKLSQHFNITSQFTNHSNHDIQITQDALNKGFRNFIIIGGDGTLNKFINGVFSQKTINPNQISFGVLAIGTGNDWIKTYKIPKNRHRALQAIIKGNTKTQDVGCLTFLDLNNSKTYFLNLCGIGFDGLVVDLVKNDRSFGKLTYIFGALKALFNFTYFDTKVTLDSETKTHKNCMMIQLGICRYTGSGMQLTKQPDPNDGLLDVSIATNFTKCQIAKNIIGLFTGSILKHENITTLKTKHITLEFNAKKPLIQADGEPMATSNIKASILPQAITFYL